MSSITGITASYNIEECAIAKTFLLSQEIDLCGAVGGTSCLDVDFLFAGKRGVGERRERPVDGEVQVDSARVV
jgi:hypothetical protein